MENFKKALKMAITEQVEAIRFEAGQIPVLLQYANDREINSLAPMADEEVMNLISSLMPNATFQPGEPCQGELSIVNFGELKLIGNLEPHPSLFVFIPPQGNQLFTQIWGQFSDPNPIEVADQQDSDQFSISSLENHGTGSFSTSNPPEEEIQQPEPPTPVSDYPGVANSEIGEEGAFEENEQAEDFGTNPGNFSIPAGEESHSHLANAEESLPFDPESIPNNIPGSGTVVLHSRNEASQRKTAFTQNSPLPTIQHHEPAQVYEDEGDNLERTGSDYPSPFTPSTPAELSHEPAAVDSGITDPGIPSTVSEEGFGGDEKKPFKINFGAHQPDETVDPNERHPIDQILKIMVEENASDLHLTQHQPVIFRIDGEIVRINNEKISTDAMEDLILPIMPKKNMLEFAINNDTDFAYSIPHLARFRVNVYRDINGVGAVLRQIPDRVLTADELGLSSAIRGLCQISKGLVVVTGPTGSGKSTTLAAMIDLINKSRAEHILTIEDPIEFVHEQKKCLVNQREVHKHTESFSRALRAALREDPDIILIGEMRDLETVAIAIETAETGHLVLGTLHTNTAISTVDRLIDQFPADQQEQIRVMLAASLKGVVAQTLIKKRNGGRCAAQEVLIVDKAVSSLIREGNTHMIQNHMQTQKSKGNILLNEALMNLVVAGDITAEDAYFKAVDKDAFLSMARQKGINLDNVS